MVKLDLDISSFTLLSNNFLALFSEFKSIKILNIRLTNNRVLSGSVECFKHCKQLKHLDINYPELREDFFANIASFVPKLQSLCIQSHKQFFDSFINCFQSMKNLKFVFHFIYISGKQDLNNCWYFGKCLSEMMLINNGEHIKQINDNCGFIALN